LETIKYTTVFVCAKKLSWAKHHGFSPYKKYKISKMFGDPEKAISLGFTDYLPNECISMVKIVNDLGNEIPFKVNSNYKTIRDPNYPYEPPFLSEFFIEEKEYRKLKLAKLKKKQFGIF
jgi:hypothetical protein